MACDTGVQTHSGWQILVSSGAHNCDMGLSDYEAIPDSNLLPIAKVGSVPPRGGTSDTQSYDTLDDVVLSKAKSTMDAGSGALECARVPGDPGQDRLRVLANPYKHDKAVFKIIKQDGTVEWTRALVTGVEQPGGRNADFDILNFQLEFVQLPIEVLPSP